MGNSHNSKLSRNQDDLDFGDYRNVTIPQLSPTQIRVLRSAYTKANAEGQYAIGKKIFDEIFLKSPELKGFFFTNCKTEAEWAAKYEAHVCNFAELVENIVGNLENLPELSDDLRQLGKRHVDFKGVGFQPRFWNVFAEAMILTSLDWEVKDVHFQQSQRAWVELVFYIIDVMKGT